MLIQNLIENTLPKQEQEPACGLHLACEHGLSFYAEAGGHRILIDAGATTAFLTNATQLGIDLSRVDTVFLSHGHYDHGGGLPEYFARFPQAVFYVRPEAFGSFYSLSGGRYHRIGIDPSLAQYPQLVYLKDPFVRIDETLSVFSGVTGKRLLSAACDNLYAYNGSAGKLTRDSVLVPSMFQPDRFLHEQSLVLTEGKKRAVFTSCSHRGIVNILDTYDNYYDQDPDLVIGGFHLMDPGSGRSIGREMVLQIAAELVRRPHTQYYTGHCTGMEAFGTLQELLGSRVHYCHTGERITL